MMSNKCFFLFFIIICAYIVSANGSNVNFIIPAACGDGVCEGNEDYVICSVDCPKPAEGDSGSGRSYIIPKNMSNASSIKPIIINKTKERPAEIANATNEIVFHEEKHAINESKPAIEQPAKSPKSNLDQIMLISISLIYAGLMVYYLLYSKHSKSHRKPKKRKQRKRNIK